MGRPINKHKLSHLLAYTPNGERRVNKQKGSKKFELSDGNTYWLVPKAQGDLQEGEMAFYARLSNNDVVQVTKISSKKLTASNGNTYAWFTSNNQVTPDDGYAWVESWEWWC
jgi:hypothetical protein